MPICDENGNDETPRHYHVCDVTTNRVLRSFVYEDEAAYELEKNPRDWLVVHTDHLASLGMRR